ncbi:lysostaphin resistance A-like protein [Streptosporangium sp. NPDC050855]|uniref:lysostaphin resistance A-like protein n=1 Tax=Streptosporangium sp. NPDC050855 TaxID=3366194 RepID=UPI0037AD6613
MPALAVLVVGLAVIAGSALWLAWTTGGEIRYTADHAGTRPMWHAWIPVLAGLVLTRLVPPRPPRAGGAPVTRELRLQAGVLLAAAALFAVSLRLVTAGGHGAEPAHTILKLVLLVAVPLLLFRLTRRGAPDREVAAPARRDVSDREAVPSSRTARRDATPGRDVRERPSAWRRYGPAVPVAAWIVLSFAGPFARPYGDWTTGLDPVTVLVTVVAVFVLNALLEEVFYRRWLQTRWEHLLGPWPATVLASLAFAAWHIGIQGTGDLPTDLASVFAGQGVQGLFLGYLWSRYRLMWPILTVHGAMNAAPTLLGLL